MVRCQYIRTRGGWDLGKEALEVLRSCSYIVIFNSLPIELVGQLLAPSVVLNYSSLLKNTLSNEIEPVGELRPTIIAVQCLPKNMEKTHLCLQHASS